MQIAPTAENAVNATNCDALLLDDISRSDTIPYIDVACDTGTVAHEASA